MLTALQGQEIPKTEKAFNIFRQELVNTAIASNQFIGNEKEIIADLMESSIDRSTFLSVNKDFSLSSVVKISSYADLSESKVGLS